MKLNKKQKYWFAQHVIKWFAKYGRKNLPWQQNITAYHVWISEIMLQQTQVATVIPFYERFIQRFATLKHLATATEEEVLHYWTGLGYYARGRNLFKAAQILYKENFKDLPNDFMILNDLPGIGRSTAAAIVSLAYGTQETILDGNVKRVLTRFFAIPGWPDKRDVNIQLWEVAQQLTPLENVQEYNQAMMDLGATICTRTNPRCESCPLQLNCVGLSQGNPTEYPHKKLTKPIPVRQKTFLIIENKDEHILLEKRPSVGIWGGLWSFPEFENTSEALEWVKQHFASSKIIYKEGEKIIHKFSHFTLEIFPLHVIANSKKSVMMNGEKRQWYSTEKSLKLGLAAPVKRLLEAI